MPEAVGTYERLRHALRSGQRLVLGGNHAWADEPVEPVIVHIKVMNQMHAPMIFALGPEDPTTRVTTRAFSKAWSKKAAQSADALIAAGIERTHPDRRFRALRLNEWFAAMLKSGADNGQTPTAANGYTGEFPAETQVSVHGFVGLDGNATHAYATSCCPLPQRPAAPEAICCSTR